MRINLKLLIIAVVFLAKIQFGQTAKIDFGQLIGKYINSNNTTSDGKSFTEISKNYNDKNCKATIEFLKDGTFKWNNCLELSIGNWEISKDKKKIILKGKVNHIEAHGELEVVELNNRQLAFLTGYEGVGNITQHFTKLK